ncbi:hypothetical protein [Candidatus Palauibacter sp.]|uniref:hypothetical protein n=1 Tax=Candidatus Palauibacter sp. TaxID=3101350 RepID=UPI003B01B54F
MAPTAGGAEEGDDNVEHVDTTECVWYGTWGWCGTTAVRVCALGYDWDETGTSCVPTFVGEGTESTGNPGSGSTPGGSNSGNQSGGNGETGTRTVEFALNCPTVPRGSDGTCSVSASGEDLGTLQFAWSSTAGGTVDATLGKSSWSGAAVSDVTVTVTISDPAGAVAGATERATAAVTPRTWTFTPPAPASTSSGYGGANWSSGKWGQHDSGSTTVSGVLAGTGPWEGLYTGDAAPVHNGDNGDNAITLHADFDSTGSAYPGAQGIACFAAANSAASANVVAVNAACGTSSRLSSWEGMALAHERDHAKSGDKCLQSATTANKIRELEAITGTKVDDVRDKLAREWNDFWTQIVGPAFEGGLSIPTSPVFWEYRFNGSWNRHAVTGGRHGGTNGC